MAPHAISIYFSPPESTTDVEVSSQPSLGLEVVQSLEQALEEKDLYTSGHAKRVVQYTMAIARHLEGLSGAALEALRCTASLHDLGKIAIDDRILQKGAPLSFDEWKQMRAHPELGRELLSRAATDMGVPAVQFKDIAAGVLHHHERWDGAGYPYRLAGEQIPLFARIVAVADAFDAMVSTRPYRAGCNPDAASREIFSSSGSQFDPRIVRAFARAFGRAQPFLEVNTTLL